MKKFIILSRSTETSKVIISTLSNLYLTGIKNIASENFLPLIFEPGTGKQNSELFSEIINEIENFAGGPGFGLNNLFIIADEIDFVSANILRQDGWNSLLGMLILATPEAHWKFGIIKTFPENAADQLLTTLHSLPSLLFPYWSPLLDGSGLRNRLLSITKNERLGKHIPLRNELAIAIDDEPGYANLHGYAAFRFGYRAYAVSSDLLAEFLLGKNGLCNVTGNIDNGEQDLKLTFEDIYLSFQDSVAKGYSNLEQRVKLLPALNQGIHPELNRFFVTMGRGLNIEQNNEVISSEPNGRQRIYKPVAGIFGLWKAADFMEPSIIKGKGFIWPIQHGNGATTDEADINTGHSSPGPIKQISQYLVQRGIKLIDKVTLLEDAMRGAVLMNIALELLGDKEPTTINKAYELKHRFEVLMESLFGGLVFPFDMKPRLQEIKSDLAIIGHWSGQENTAEVKLNNELTIVNYFIKLFENKNELEKAESCRHESRFVQRKLWWLKSRKQSFLKKCGASLILPVRWYIDLLLTSIGHIICAIILWIVALYLFNIVNGLTMPDAMLNAFNPFFGGSINQPSSTFDLVIGGVAVVSGFFHLGILISHLYATTVRK